jgi:hypothetical protein
LAQSLVKENRVVSVVSSVAAAKLVTAALVAALVTALLGWTEERGGVCLLPPSPAVDDHGGASWPHLKPAQVAVEHGDDLKTRHV